MAVAEYYVPTPLVRYRSRIGLGVQQYFQGTTMGSYMAFGALAAVFLIAIFARQIAPYDPLAAVGQPMTAPNAANLLAPIAGHMFFNAVNFAALVMDLPGWLEKFVDQ